MTALKNKQSRRIVPRNFPLLPRKLKDEYSESDCKVKGTKVPFEYKDLIPRALYLSEMRKNFARNELVHAH